MKVTGIIAEYDPLHKGHVYHMEESRRLSGCDALAVAMSGDFVQRGGPALIDKWSRAKAALSCGADLVIEIPALFCLADASKYAHAGVTLLEALGAEVISFGSECGDAALIKDAADLISSRKAEIDAEITALGREGLSYPAAREEAYRAVRSGSGGLGGLERELQILRRPNDLLALEYVMSMKRSEPLAIRRMGAGHDEAASDKARDNDTVNDTDIRSASALRAMLRAGGDISSYVPEPSMEIINKSKGYMCCCDDLFDILRYSVISGRAFPVDDCPSGGEGLGNLIRSEILKAGSWEELVLAVKSKRYTYTRISRLFMQIILGITRTACPWDEPSYIRVLGFGEKGRELLSEIKKDGSSLPVVTNVNKEARALGPDALSMLELDMKASDIYNIVTGRDCVRNSDHIMKPVIIG